MHLRSQAQKGELRGMHMAWNMDGGSLQLVSAESRGAHAVPLSCTALQYLEDSNSSQELKKSDLSTIMPSI